MQKVVCLMPTRGRFRIAQRSISFFLQQTYENKELVVFNQGPVPMSVSDPSLFPNVKIVNTQKEYDGLYDVYTEALTHCEGDLINMWDDDNGQFPWLLEETIAQKQKKGAKTESSWVWTGGKLSLGQNLLEPSVVFDMSVIRELGFTEGKSFVHTGWFYSLYHAGELQHIKPPAVPGLVYVWGEAGSGCFHISCTSDEAAGFAGFKKHSLDFGSEVGGVLKLVDVRPWWSMVTQEHQELQQRLGL